LPFATNRVARLGIDDRNVSWTARIRGAKIIPGGFVRSGIFRKDCLTGNTSPFARSSAPRSARLQAPTQWRAPMPFPALVTKRRLARGTERIAQQAHGGQACKKWYGGGYFAVRGCGIFRVPLSAEKNRSVPRRLRATGACFYWSIPAFSGGGQFIRPNGKRAPTPK
jgi:hypothetical protein